MYNVYCFSVFYSEYFKLISFMIAFNIIGNGKGTLLV